MEWGEVNMRLIWLILASVVLSGQTYVYDANGRKVLLPGPEEKREKRMVEEGPNGKVSEEVIERRDVNGNKLPAETVRTVERKGESGETIVESTTYRTDLNGKMTVAERQVETTRKKGEQTFSTTVVEQPTVNGGFVAVERTDSQAVSKGDKTQTNRSTYVRDASGNFVEAVREQSERVSDAKGVREVTQEYRNAPTGKMELSGQRVKVDQTNSDGTSTSEITIYGVAAPGRAAEGQLQLREQQLVKVQPGEGNTQVESISVRRPDLADSKLGEYQKVSEKVTTKPKP
jgi:hypothetical protein